MTDSPNQRLCTGCKEWIDARAPSCYLCGAEAPERNAALVNAVHTERVNANLLMQANGARRDGSINVPQNAKGVAPIDRQGMRGGKPRVYNERSAGGLVEHFRNELRNGNFGE